MREIPGGSGSDGGHEQKIGPREKSKVRLDDQTALVQRDLASTGVRMALFWGPGVLVLIVTANLGWWEHVIGWTAGLLWLAAICLWNAARCRRVHCLFTGPFFLAMAVVTLLVGFRIIWLGNRTWNMLSAAVLIGGIKKEQPLLIRWDASFPTLYQIRRRGMHSTPIAYATAYLAALFVKHFPRNLAGVFPPEALPTDTRRAIVADARSRDIRVALKITRLKKSEEDELEI